MYYYTPTTGRMLWLSIPGVRVRRRSVLGVVGVVSRRRCEALSCPRRPALLLWWRSPRRQRLVPSSSATLSVASPQQYRVSETVGLQPQVMQGRENWHKTGYLEKRSVSAPEMMPSALKDMVPALDAAEPLKNW